MKEIKFIRIKNLVDYDLHPSITSGGFGLCGYNYEDGGYIYLNSGYGNAETYVNAETLIHMLEKDRHSLEVEIKVELEDGKLVYTYFDILKY